jgi:hypothetical protein
VDPTIVRLVIFHSTVTMQNDGGVCHTVTSLIKPDCPAHIGQMMKSPLKAEFKGAHFENYDKMYSTGTWSFPVLRYLIPAAAVLLAILPEYAVESTST